jgi:hypothetical protein
MRNAKQVLDETFMDMRRRCVALAADLDRVERAAGGEQILHTDPRLKLLEEAIKVLYQGAHNRAEQVELVLSDKSPPPAR